MQDEPELEHVFVKKVVTLAMDRHDRERELASVLLSSLYGEVLFRVDLLGALKYARLDAHLMPETLLVSCTLMTGTTACYPPGAMQMPSSRFQSSC
jgi:hypothetical protein